MMEKTWIEVEIDESLAVLRKKLEAINKVDGEDMSREDVNEMNDVYDTIEKVWCLKQKMAKKA